MNDNSTQTTTVEKASTTLAEIVKPLDEKRAATLRESFGAMFTQLESWNEEAKHLVVTDEGDTGKMARARLLRLEIKKKRVELDKKRKALKEGILVEGRAIDGAFRVFEGMAAPLEKLLEEQETFAERADASRKDALRIARRSALDALGVLPQAMPADLAAIDDFTYDTMVSDAEAAMKAREAAAQKAEADRVEAERVAAEQEAVRKAEAARLEAERVAREEAQRAENERLRAQAAAQEEALRAERERSDAAARQAEADRAAERERHAAAAKKVEEASRLEREALERKAAAERTELEGKARREREEAEARARAAAEAQAKADAELARLRREDEERRAKEAAAKKPTKAKYATAVSALREIVKMVDAAPDGSSVERIAGVATNALVAIGEEAS